MRDEEGFHKTGGKKQVEEKNIGKTDGIWIKGYIAEMCSDSRESLDHSDPPCFFSLDTSLDIKTVISKVLIPVSISRLKISESRFQSRYQDSNFKSLDDSSLNIKTQLWKVSILVSMSRLDSWIYNLCSNFDTGSAKQKILENAT